VRVVLPRFTAVPAGPAAGLPSGHDQLVIGLPPGGALGRAARAALGAELAEHCAAVLGASGARGAAGEVTVVRAPGAPGGPAAEILVVGTGPGDALSLAGAGAAAARRRGTAARVLLRVEASTPERLRALVEGYALASYAVARRGSAPAPTEPVGVDVASTLPSAAEAVRLASVTGSAVFLARDLANAPANEKSPAWLADQAQREARRTGLRIRVRDERELRAEGFGGLIGVGRGSSRPPRFVELGYVPPGSDGHEPHAVLVGKGIVFDSGGISIKPASGMESMKTDMAGAAAVIAVLGALRDLGARVRVTGLLAIAENLPGADAQRPSDVIVPYGAARSVEVTNTDAEGRLVLADGLAYADAVLDPDVVVDIATLTGAVSLALGRRDAGLFASDEGLAAAIERAAGPARERVWRLPLVEDYRPALDSATADLVNAVTDRTVSGGAIMAALFLREFTGGRPWAHLDIAGTGRSDTDVDELSRGATGFGVRLLLRWLTSGRLR
jgi:leucyl aminopeptidase